MSDPVPAPPSARRFKVAFETVTWGQRIDDLDYMCQVLQACGYKGIEIAQNPQNIFVQDDGRPRPVSCIDELVQKCSGYGIQVIGLVGGTLEERVEYLGTRRDIYLYLDSWPEGAWKYLVQENPYNLAIHPHWFMPIRKRSHVEALFNKVSDEVYAFFLNCGQNADIATLNSSSACAHLRLIVDTANSVIAEDDPIAFVDACFNGCSILNGRLQTIHLKGWKPNFGRWSQRYSKGFCLPDEGIVPVEQVMDVLAQTAYQGWLVMEHDNINWSRETTALACAEWISSHRERWGVNIEAERDTVKELAKSRPVSPFKAQIQDQALEAIGVELANTRVTSAEAFYHSAVTYLRGQLKPECIKLFSYNSTTQFFYLLDALRHDEHPVNCRTAISTSNSLAAQIATASRVLFHDLTIPETKEMFRDKAFLDQVQSRWMISVPIFNAANAHHLRGMFAIFSDRDWRGEVRRLEHLARIFAMHADFIGGEACASASGATNYLCGLTKPDVTSFIDALRDHLMEMFHCDSVSIFIKDSSRTRLEPVGKCVKFMKWDKNLPLTERHYKLGDGLTGRCWKGREMIFADHARNELGHKGKCKDIPLAGDQREEVLFAPLVRLGGEVHGVIRLRNKRPRPGSAASTMFTDDDAAKLDATIQAALPHLELLLSQSQQAQSLKRLNHELQGPLTGITGAVELLREKLKKLGFKDLKKEFDADYLDDVLSYKDLMSRLALNAKLFGDSFDSLEPNFERCDLEVSVVEPVARQLHPLIKKYSLPDSRIHVEKFQGVVPWLWVDKLMMQQVFFNLLANAIKYREIICDFEVLVEVDCISHNGVPVEYWIDVVDYGIGLDHDTETVERVFLPGVRGASVASSKDVSGSGIGLSVVRDVVEKHGGKVYFVPNARSEAGNEQEGEKSCNPFRKPTRVRVSLPASLRHGKPKAK